MSEHCFVDPKLHEDIGEIKGTLSSLAREVKKVTEDHEKRLDNHSDRIRGLEKWRARATGAVATAVALPSAVWAWFKFGGGS